MHFEVSKYEDFDGNLGFKNRSTELEICSSAHKISGILIQRTYLRLEFQVNILGFRRMQKQQLSCDLRKTVIPSRPYDDARMRSVTSDPQINEVVCPTTPRDPPRDPPETHQ